MNRCWRHDIQYEGSRCPRCVEDDRYADQRARQQRLDDENRERERRQEREQAEAEREARDRERQRQLEEQVRHDELMREQEAARRAAEEAARSERERLSGEKAHREQERADRELRAGLPEFSETFRQEWYRLNKALRALDQRDEASLRELGEPKALSLLRELWQNDIALAETEAEETGLSAGREGIERDRASALAVAREAAVDLLQEEYAARRQRPLTTEGEWFAESNDERAAWEKLTDAYRVCMTDPVLATMWQARKVKESWPEKLESFLEIERMMPLHVTPSEMPRIGAFWHWGINRRRALAVANGFLETVFRMARLLSQSSVKSGASSAKGAIDWSAFASVYAKRVAAHPERYRRPDILEIVDQECAKFDDEKKRFDGRAELSATRQEALRSRRAELLSAYEEIRQQVWAKVEARRDQIRKAGAEILQGLRLPNTHGEIQRCPACAGPLALGGTSCIYCGATFGAAG